MRRLSAAAVGTALLALAGCQRLNYEATYDFDHGVSYREAEFDPPRGEQKLQVTATSDREPISVWVVLKDDRDAAERDLQRKVKPEKAVAGQDNSKDISFEATVPARKAFIVFTHTAKGAGAVTKVKLNVKSR